MKVISIKQPWASLIAHGIKDIENRTWKTKFRGRILVHVSGPTKFNADFTDDQAKLIGPIIKTAIDGSMPFGAIIGEVDIINCVQNHPSIWAERNKGIWNWVLTNPVLYNEPILNIKGKLSIWNYEFENLKPINYKN